MTLSLTAQALELIETEADLKYRRRYADRWKATRAAGKEAGASTTAAADGLTTPARRSRRVSAPTKGD